MRSALIERPPGNKAPKILCAGIAVQDIIFRVERFPTPANKVPAQDVVVTGGGCAANAAIAVARLGALARYAGPLGDDAVSDAILAGLGAEHVDTTGVVRKVGARAPRREQQLRWRQQPAQAQRTRSR